MRAASKKFDVSVILETSENSEEELEHAPSTSMTQSSVTRPTRDKKTGGKSEQQGTVWKEGILTSEKHDGQFRGNKSLPASFEELDDPFELFKYLLSDDLINHIFQQTNFYKSQM